MASFLAVWRWRWANLESERKRVICPVWVYRSGSHLFRGIFTRPLNSRPAFLAFARTSRSSGCSATAGNEHFQERAHRWKAGTKNSRVGFQGGPHPDIDEVVEEVHGVLVLSNCIEA